MILQSKKNQGVQCSIQNSSTNISSNEYSKHSLSNKSNVSRKNEKNGETYPLFNSHIKFHN
jgi:hypothetical protein